MSIGLSKESWDSLVKLWKDSEKKKMFSGFEKTECLIY